MTVHRLLALCGVAVVAAACGSDSKGTTTPSDNVAYVRYVNAIPDTSGVDFRFVDVIENSPLFPNVTFRQYTPYQATGVGKRRIKVFINPTPYRPDSSQIIAKQFLVDTTVTFEPKTYYTILHAGYARAGSTPKQQFYVIKDDIPAPAGGKISLRAINALFTASTGVNVFVAHDTVTTPFTGTPAFANVPLLGAANAVTAYAAYAARDTLPAANSYKLGVQGTAASDSLAAATAPAFIGASGTTAVAGAQIDNTVFSALLLPRSVAGSKAASFTTPGVLFMVDRAGRKP